MTNKERYRKFCATHQVVPVFSSPFWLDTVAENWDVCLISEGESESESEDGKIIAALPYCWKGNLFTKRIYLPDVSFYQSVLFFSDANKSKQQHIMEQLAEQLPKTVKSYFKLLPQYSHLHLNRYGFTRETYITNIIAKEQPEIALSSHHKRNVQKGNKQQYTIKESNNPELSFSLLASTFIRQKLKFKLSSKDFIQLNALLKKHQAGRTLDCVDTDNNLLASALVAEDASTVYYLFGGYNTDFRNSGAMTFLLHHIIQDALHRNLDFNFCGSAKKSIAAYFEGFGATKTEVVIWKKSIL